MGKGDKKSKRGKIFMGSYGVSRQKKSNKSAIIPTTTPKKDAPKKTEKPVVAEATSETVEVVEKPKKEKAPKKETVKTEAKAPKAKKEKQVEE